jgi:outer membrane lipoprotein SlyB
MKTVASRLFSLMALSALILGGLPLADPSFANAEAQTRRRSTSRSAYVPAGTQLKVRLNDTKSSEESRVGDRFTATVFDPDRYDGAVVHGRISVLEKSGRVKGRTRIALAFDSIEFTDGRSGRMRGELIQVYDEKESTKVDEEGTVESGSRGNQTLKRGGIGAAAGAILGGIVGGGKGAAIGLIVGGAAGAGSIAIDGGKELKLEAGTEMLVRVTSR